MADRALDLHVHAESYLEIQEERPAKPRTSKTLKHWLDPISKRVILIFLNGLEKDFLSQNSTPFLKEMLDEYGSFGVVLTGYMQTNLEGIRTVLTGKKGPVFPFSWMNTNCPDNVMDYVTFSCGMGKLPLDLSWRCHFSDEYPLGSFQKFPGLFELKRRKSSLYIMSMDLDPVLIENYHSRLRKIDDDIRFFVTLVDNFYADNQTTYIVTSARGSPVGKNLSIDAPILAWGRGIDLTEKTTYLKQTDLTAMLCALLGINFPSGMFGIIPMKMMDLQDHYEYELTLYTIRHFEKVLELADAKEHVYDSSELELEQLSTRLQHIILGIKEAKLIKWTTTCLLLVLLLAVWGLNLTSCAASGFASFFWPLKSLFLLLLVVGTTLYYSLLGLELLVALELLLFCTWQNNKQILEGLHKNIALMFEAQVVTFTAVTAVGLIGNQIVMPLMLVPVILWPLVDGSYLRLNRYVFFTRLVSGVALGALPLNRIFGVMPDRVIMASVSFLFLLNFYFLIFMFKRKFDVYMKINFFVISATTVHVYFIRQYEFPLMRDLLSCLFLAFAFLSVYVASGTLLEKLFKILLSLFIPVIMLTIRFECVFYLCIFFHVFSWIFTEYHSANPLQYQFYPAVFSIEPKKPLKAVYFSDEDARHIIFFVVYSYVSYFAIGHFPDLHSYDLYVVPNFFFQYPITLSYFLGAFKFVLPFFIVTASFLTLCLVKEKDFRPFLLVALWISDLIGSFFIFYSQLMNRLFRRTLFPAKFSYFIIQQFITASVIFSYFLAKYLLLNSDRFLQKIFRRKIVDEQVEKN